MKNENDRDLQECRGGILDRLKPEEAAEVLRRLAKCRQDLVPEIEWIAKSVCFETSVESVATRLEGDLLVLKICEIHERSQIFGKSYIEPTEAAWMVLKHRLEPYLEEMKRALALGLKDVALGVAKGIVLGLFRAGKNKDDESMLNWDPEFVETESGNMMEFWKSLRDEAAWEEIAKFVEKSARPVPPQ